MAADKRTEHMIETVRPYLAHRVLQPFLEAYQVVADQLVLAPISTSFDEKSFISNCIDVAHQRRLRQQIRSNESVSGELFATALNLARNRNLIEVDDDGVRARRLAFARRSRSRSNVCAISEHSRMHGSIRCDAGTGRRCGSDHSEANRAPAANEEVGL